MERKLAAIFHADVKGYSRLIGEDEVTTLRIVASHLAIMRTLVGQHGGRAVGSRGDSLLAEFPSVVEAVQCAVEMQRELRVKNAEFPVERRVEFRIGINLGEVVVEGEEIYGDGVNIAVRLEGLAEAERALALDPNYADSYAYLADVLNAVGRVEEAIGLAEKAMRLNPRGQEAGWYLLELGHAYLFTGQVEEAIATFKQSLMRDPNSLFGYINLAYSYVLEWIWQLSQDPQPLEQALALAQQTIALNDSFPWAHTALGSVYLLQKQHDQALAEAERALALNPNLADGYALLAAILNAMGKPEEAIGVAENAVRLGSLNPDGYLFDLGHAYCVTGRYEEAITTLKKFIIRNPNVLHAQLVLAIAYSEVGRDEEARTTAAEVLRISPKFSLEVWKERVPYKDPAVVERQVAALRKAGMK